MLRFQALLPLQALEEVEGHLQAPEGMLLRVLEKLLLGMNPGMALVQTAQHVMRVPQQVHWERALCWTLGKPCQHLLLTEQEDLNAT